MPVRVVLADDQRLVRESLGKMLGLLDGIELVASASDGKEALALCDEHKPDGRADGPADATPGRDRGDSMPA